MRMARAAGESQATLAWGETGEVSAITEIGRGPARQRAETLPTEPMAQLLRATQARAEKTWQSLTRSRRRRDRLRSCGNPRRSPAVQTATARRGEDESPPDSCPRLAQPAPAGRTPCG